MKAVMGWVIFMQKFKRCSLFIAAIMLIFNILVCPSVIAGGEISDVVITLQIDNPIMEFNGKEAKIDAGYGTKPIIADGRTLVPVRSVIEAMGGDVFWEESTQSVLLTMEDDTIKLVIDSNIAYFNNSEEILDTAPAVINDRTMLPIRFIAECFNLGVAWDEDSQTVSIVRNSFDSDEYNALMSMVPEYSGQAYVIVNNNEPFFKDYEIIKGSFEYYSDLDELERCNVCFASVAEDLMPEEERESISSVTPTGWMNASYDSIDGDYLYNRCHLIGYQLTGENANEKNLITGTRYLNVEGMLPFENLIKDYIEETKNHVIYRATPVFKEDDLVAGGVLLEAYSVEDDGQGVSFCVYCYNVQPHIIIDYKTGANTEDDTGANVQTDEENDINSVVYRTPSGKKYHFDAECGGKNSYGVTLKEAKEAGLTPCLKCAE